MKSRRESLQYGMLLFLRKLLFYLLLIFYFIITPYAILYALGYLFNPLDIALVKTGVVSIDTYPRYATVYLEGKKFSRKSPTVIRDLLPGTYSLRIAKKGFDDWSKKIVIEPEKATRLEPVLLLPRSPEREILSARNYKGMIPGILDQKIIAWLNEDLSSLNKIDLLFRRTTPVIADLESFRGFKITNFDYLKGSSIAFLEAEKGSQKQYFLLQPGWIKATFQSLNVWKNDAPDQIFWDARNSSQVYSLKEGMLSRILLRDQEDAQVIARNILGAGIKQNRLYLLDKNFNLAEANLLGEISRQDLGLADAFKNVLSQIQAKFYSMKILERDLMIFLSDQGALLSQHDPYLLVQEGVRDALPAKGDNEDKVVFWTPKTMGVLYFFQEKNGFGEPVESKWVKQVLYRKGKNIQQVFWAFDNTHLVFLDGDHIMILETEAAKPFYIRQIARVVPGSQIDYEEWDHSLYYLEADTGNLIKRKLID